MNTEYYMNEAYKQALLAYKEDEIPVGCVIVQDNRILAKAHNQKERKKDPTSHAEIECIRKACRKIKKKYLNKAEMYITLEPCLMCAGAIKEARIKKVYVGVKDFKGGMIVSRETKLNKKDVDKYNFGYLEDKISILLKTFFINKR